MARERQHLHPTDGALTDLVNSESSRDENIWSHVLGCAACKVRIRELTTVRNALHAVGDSLQQPERNVAREAVRRLRARGAAVAGVNEFIAVWRSLLRGLNAFFGSGDSATSVKSTSKPEEEERHG